MYRIIVISLFIISISVELFGQTVDNNWGLSIDYGSIEYYGELGNQIGDMSQWQSGYGLCISKYLSPEFNIGFRCGYNKLSVTGPDDFNYSMNGDIYTLLGYFDFKLANSLALKTDSKIKPYLKFGGGKMLGKTWGSSYDNNGEYYSLRLNDWVYSVAGGTKINIAPKIDFFAEFGKLWITTVGMDGSKMDDSKDHFFQLNIGCSYAFGGFKDSDNDGIPDKTDRCPDTPHGLDVDDLGCPLDTDGDGIADYQDDCPDDFGTKRTNGCADMDHDGIADHIDKCPQQYGLIVNQGCPVASQIRETIQNLPSTAGTGVNIYYIFPATGKGLPQVYSMPQNSNMTGPYNPDIDGDGITNNYDHCPNIPGSIVNFGCPKEGTNTTDAVQSTVQPQYSNPVVNNNEALADKDTQAQLSNEPQEKELLNGAPFDIAEKDKTRVTSQIEEVDINSNQDPCPSDMDCDGVLDSEDECPNEFGSTNTGCPEETEGIKWRNDIKVPAVHFTTTKSYLTEFSKNRVDKLVKIMNNDPDLNVWLFGHADPRGSSNFNEELSAKRINTVLSYLVSKGISEQRIFTIPMGETSPVQTDSGADDLMKSRRVEFGLFER